MKCDTQIMTQSHNLNVLISSKLQRFKHSKHKIWSIYSTNIASTFSRASTIQTKSWTCSLQQSLLSPASIAYVCMLTTSYIASHIYLLNERFACNKTLRNCAWRSIALFTWVRGRCTWIQGTNNSKKVEQGACHTTQGRDVRSNWTWSCFLT